MQNRGLTEIKSSSPAATSRARKLKYAASGLVVTAWLLGGPAAANAACLTLDRTSDNDANFFVHNYNVTVGVNEPTEGTEIGAA